MSCEEQRNALRQAEYALARFREQHPGVGDGPGPASGTTGSGAVEEDAVQRLAELTSTVWHRREAYNKCQDLVGAGTDVESLMRDATGRPKGGGAGPPM